jgi:hypothetical protein
VRWTASALVVCVCSVLGGAVESVVADPIAANFNIPTALASDSIDKPVEYLLGIRLGLTDNPRLDLGVDRRDSRSRAGYIGAQATLVHERHFTLGLGLEHLATRYTHFREDSLNGLVEDNQFSGWLFYISPGAHSRLGNDQPLGFGVSVDAGYLWASENFLTHDFESYWSERIFALRPKMTATYDISPDMFLQLESGWLWAEKTGYRIYYDYFDGPSYGYAWEMDFTGPYFGSMLTIRLPNGSRRVQKFADPSPEARSTESGPNIIAGLRAGILPGDVESLPARWDFDGDCGSPIAGGLQVSLTTRKKTELGLGFEHLNTPYADSRDTTFGGDTRVEGSFLYATIVYEGLSTPIERVPLGIGLDVGHLWAREDIRYQSRDWSYTNSNDLEGNAARIKFTASPRIARGVGLRFEIGWLFAALGNQQPPVTPVQPGYRSEWSVPELMDFSGLSLMAMIRLMPE